LRLLHGALLVRLMPIDEIVIKDILLGSIEEITDDT
jgi:hypothetical protein